jgi:hypothetical protein
MTYDACKTRCGGFCGDCAPLAGFVFFLEAGGTFALDLHGTGGRHVGDAHAHHRIRNGVGFRLRGGGIDGANPEIGLNERRTWDRGEQL